MELLCVCVSLRFYLYWQVYMYSTSVLAQFIGYALITICVWVVSERIILLFPSVGSRGQLKCDGTRKQKPDFVFRRNGRVHLNQRGRQFIRLLAADVCASAVVMLDTPCCEVVWRVLATHSIRQFPLHLPSRASPCAVTFQLECTDIPVSSCNGCLKGWYCNIRNCFLRTLGGIDIIIIIIISNLSNDRSKASSRTIPPHSAI